MVSTIVNAADKSNRAAAERLADIPLFQPLDSELLRAIARHCRPCRFRSGEFVVRQSTPSKFVHFVISGHARSVVYSTSGKEVAFSEYAAGDYFGVREAVEGRPHQMSVVALSDVELLVLPNSVFVNVLLGHRGISVSLMRSLCTTVRGLSERVCEFSTLGVQARVRAELLRIACRQQSTRAVHRSQRTAREPAHSASHRNQVRDGSRIRDESPARGGSHVVARLHRLTALDRVTSGAANGIIIKRFPTHSDLANRISTHREAVTREINRLERAGLIQRHDGDFIVPDLERLRHLVSKGDASVTRLH